MDYYLEILKYGLPTLLFFGYFIRRNRRRILRSNLKTFLVLFTCGLASSFIPWSIFGAILGFVPSLITAITLHFWLDTYGRQRWFKTFLIVLGFSVLATSLYNFVLSGGTPLGILQYAWQSIILASILATLLLEKGK